MTPKRGLCAAAAILVLCVTAVGGAPLVTDDATLDDLQRSDGANAGAVLAACPPELAPSFTLVGRLVPASAPSPATTRVAAPASLRAPPSP
jgi:hypothetical protein